MVHQRKVFLLKPEYPSFGISGSRGSGKSTLLEFILLWYKKHHYVPLDFFGSIDGENCYYCIPDISPICQWNRIPGEDDNKLGKYLRKCFNIPEDQQLTIRRLDDYTVAVKNEATQSQFVITLNGSMTRGKLLIDPDTPFPRRRRLITRKDVDGNIIVYGRNPERTDKSVRLVGHPVLIILPKSTLIKQRNPMCICGIAMAEHGSQYSCKKKDLLIKTITDDVPLKEVIELTAKENRICVFNRGFFADQRDAYRTLARMLKELPFLILKGAIPKERSICLAMREAGSIAPSGLKGMRGDSETQTKRELQTYIREARHLRTVLCLDFQRSSDIAKSIASQRDVLFLKRSTLDLLPDDYQYLYHQIENNRNNSSYNLDFGADKKYPSISQLKHWQVYVLFPDRHIELRQHGLPDFHHKKPHDSWAEDANCEIEYLDKKEIERSKDELKIKKLTKKSHDKQQRLQALKDAKALRDEGMILQDIAVKIGWLGLDGKPSAAALQRALARAIEKGQV